MAVAETNKIITHGDGQSIATSIQNIANAINDQEKNVHLSDTQTITGAKTFTSPIKTSEIDNTAGNAMLRNKDTEGAIVLGSSAKKAVIMGSGDRPTYSKDGSDFAGSELALKSDVPSTTEFVDNLYSTLGLYRFADKIFYGYIPADPFLNYYTSAVGYLADSKMYNAEGASTYKGTVTLDFSSRTADAPLYVERMFEHFGTENVTGAYLDIVIKNLSMTACDFMFQGCTARTITFENCKFKYYKYNKRWYKTFVSMKNLTAITGDYDVSDISIFTSPFEYCSNLKDLSAFKHWKVSWSIGPSTAFEEADLVEILNNLDPVSTTQTLTMGATNLAKLTSDDILIATGKGWALA